MDIKDLEAIRDAIGAKTITTGTERNLETGDFTSGVSITFADGKTLHVAAPLQTRKVDLVIVLENLD